MPKKLREGFIGGAGLGKDKIKGIGKFVTVTNLQGVNFIKNYPPKNMQICNNCKFADYKNSQLQDTQNKSL